jgi:hypothetical protein
VGEAQGPQRLQQRRSDRCDQIGANRTISANRTGPLDANGLPTTFTQGSLFGQATSNAHFVTPQEYLISAGIRF